MSLTDEILEKLKALTLVESRELVLKIEEAFGVDASAPVGGRVAMPVIRGAVGAPRAEAEKTTFDVVLESVAEDKRVASLKVIRGLTDLGLKEAKDFCSSLPKTVKRGISKEEADAVKKELEGAGGKAVIN